MKLDQIVTQMESETKAPTAESPSVERIAYRPQGRLHPEQWKALVNGRFVDVTPASARLVLDLARDMTDYKIAALTRHPWRIGIPDDGGRKWWGYDLRPNSLAAHLVEVTQ